tara:strand:- start:610 stop:2397 length:1788 start_codon:yes stop_codon:yes gene_type:complete
MQIYKVPLRDMKFIIRDFIEPSFFENSDLDKSDLEMILDEASKICEETLFPINQSGDIEGCKFDKGKVFTPKNFKEAYKSFVENGWQGIKVSDKYGGQNLPYFMNMFFDEMLSSSNMSFSLYPGLTSNAIDAIENSATEDLKNLYLPKLTSGEWSGTMNLTEPQCGTDLGLSKAMAIPQKDGSYKLTGTKIFITCGEHDLSENIIHLVLARTPDAPEGIKGISLFLVPKIIPNNDGTLNEKNNVECGSIEKKMGINGSPTCVMHYNDAKGWLVGDLNKGMKAMFIMMNGARLFVGIQGLGISEVAFQSSLYYSKERLQGRSPNGITHSDKLADPIIVHPEIRKSLLKMKSLNEGIRGLMILTGLQIDLSNKKINSEIEIFSNDWVSLMTPVLKSFATDVGLESANTALQIYGGHGYVKDHGIEQLVRDARIGPIYEGTNGIQALDLVGRKLHIEERRLFKNFILYVEEFINKNESNEYLSSFFKLFKNSFEDLKKASDYIYENYENKSKMLSPAVDYLKIFALVSIGFIWLRFIEISNNKNEEEDKEGFYKSKIETGIFYITQVLPETNSLLTKIISGSDSYNKYDDKFFDLGFN